MNELQKDANIAVVRSFTLMLLVTWQLILRRRNRY